MTILERMRARIRSVGGDVIKTTRPDDERTTFINDNESLGRMKLKEYNVWYDGDGDELLNFYTRQDLIGYNYEPFYARNKKNYFWAISATEAQIKRTHSGQPRNIVDTLVNIMPFPMLGMGENSETAAGLMRIVRESGLESVYKNEQLPLTLVEGWGCWKINWDKDVSDYPSVEYITAENVDFVYKNGKVVGVIFKNYYTSERKRYMLLETRRIMYKRNEDADAGARDNNIYNNNIYNNNNIYTRTHAHAREGERVLVIENELYEMPTNMRRDDDTPLKKVELSSVPELAAVQERIEIGPFDKLFAVPCVLLGNTSKQWGYGRSIFTGKIDLFDDLDQALSQSSNAVRLSTPIEYIDDEYLERDQNGLPKKPHAYDRKYVMMKGQKNGDGVSTGQPVQVTQPTVDFTRYSDHAVQILLQILNGILSPATLGIDVAKKDNAAAQREKEKVTIFTRNALISGEEEILRSLLQQLMMAKEFMDTGAITTQDYDISVKFNEFADDSFENKLEALGKAYDMEEISTDMYLNKLYGDTLSSEERAAEKEFLESSRQARTDAYANAGGDGANTQGMIDNIFDRNGKDEG